MEHKFQINLGGIIDLLSNHLYSSPSVYIRELLQNGVDAISARRHFETEHQGHIQLQLAMSDVGRPQLVFTDDGVGLTEAETHQFLSTIGESSKREMVEAQRADFIGQFGIGLLSCFIVSDEILMVTRSVHSAEVVEWRGRADGTYRVAVREDGSVPVGTTVFLSCKPGCEDWFAPERVRELVTNYGALLPFPITLTADQGLEHLNATDVPWRTEFTSARAERLANMEFGKRMFGQDFFDCVPLHSEVGQVNGVAYILPFTPSPTAKKAHRVYLKNMLLSEASDNLLPPWAFFVTCIVNTNELRPVASREAFYEDATLQHTRDALGEALRNYLIDLKENDPDRLYALINLHYRAIKALAVYDDDFFELFIDMLPFETSMGRMALGEFRKSNPIVRYVPSVDTFRQIAQVAASQKMGVINAGYSYDADLLEKLGMVFPDIEVERIDSTDLAENFEDLTLDEQDDAYALIQIADLALKHFKCRSDVKKFTPSDLPALYLAGEDANFMRSLQQSQDVADDHWGAILNNMASTRKTDGFAQLCFNFTNPLIRKLIRTEDHEVLRLAVQMLYVQALLMGHHPLAASEMALLNTGLIDLIEAAVSDDSQGWVQ